MAEGKKSARIRNPGAGHAKGRPGGIRPNIERVIGPFLSRNARRMLDYMKSILVASPFVLALGTVGLARAAHRPEPTCDTHARSVTPVSDAAKLTEEWLGNAMEIHLERTRVEELRRRASQAGDRLASTLVPFSEAPITSTEAEGGTRLSFNSKDLLAFFRKRQEMAKRLAASSQEGQEAVSREKGLERRTSRNAMIQSRLKANGRSRLVASLEKNYSKGSPSLANVDVERLLRPAEYRKQDATVICSDGVTATIGAHGIKVSR